MSGPLLEAVGLSKHFHTSTGLFNQHGRTVRAVDDVSFTIEKGKTLALVGESGCGKTTTARMILLLEPTTGGHVRLDGQDCTHLRGEALMSYRKSVQAVFQDPFSSLSPRMRVWEIIGEPLIAHKGLRGKALQARVAELLDQVGIARYKATYYPHQFSGGQRQRIALARALALNPRLIVLDEPVSALDVSIRAQVLNLLSDLQDQLGLSYLLISHDLALVEHMSHEVAVMYAGKIVERAPTEALFADPRHPYTRALIAAVPNPDPDVAMGELVEGEPANPANLPPGCRFHTRCPLFVDGLCNVKEPPLLADLSGHFTACHLVEQAEVRAA